MTGSIVEPQRAKDITKVAKGEVAPRPPHEPGTVSPPPPPSSTTTPEEKAAEEEKSRRCYSCYLQYLTCTKQKGEGAHECKKLADEYKSNCPSEWMEKWKGEEGH